MDQYDVIIAGSGLVGSSLACALNDSGLTVLQVEPRAVDAKLPAANYDERHFVLGRASIDALSQFDAWPAMRAHAHPVEKIHVSRQGGFAAVRFTASDYDLSALGYTVPARIVAGALEVRAQQCQQVERWHSASVLDFSVTDQAVTCRIQTSTGERQVHCKLLVGADGTQSTVRQVAGIGVEEKDYAQTAIVTTVTASKPHQSRAYERFSEHGPLALLPLSENRLGVICTVRAEHAQSHAESSEQDFLQWLTQRFGHRLGQLGQLGKRQLWPLKRVLAEKISDPRIALIGNAAQTVHPVGAQGFNLGLRDAMDLAAQIRHSLQQHQDIGSPAAMQRYAATRKADRDATLAFSDQLATAFISAGALRSGLHSLAMLALERAPSIKRELAYSAMGYRERGWQQ